MSTPLYFRVDDDVIPALDAVAKRAQRTRSQQVAYYVKQGLRAEAGDDANDRDMPAALSEWVDSQREG